LQHAVCAEATVTPAFKRRFCFWAAVVLLEVKGISKRFGANRVLRDVSFSVNDAEILGLIGPNGAGKTTLFECLAGVLPADQGRVFSNASQVDASQRSSMLFFIPDGIAPWPDQPVQWALQFSLGFWGGRRHLYRDVVNDLGLEPFLHMPIGTLSKGQRKRVLLAIGLLSPQPILAIDEPFDGLDLRQSREAAAALRNHVSGGRTLFVSIHQIGDAARICDRFVLLSDGRVAGEGTLEELAALAGKRLGQAPPSNFEEVFLALT
jgi:ABC-2 type transport system ATP-binding protein